MRLGPLAPALVGGVSGKQAFQGCLGRAVLYPGNQTQSQILLRPRLPPSTGRHEEWQQSRLPSGPTPPSAGPELCRGPHPPWVTIPCPVLACFFHHHFSGLPGTAFGYNLICEGDIVCPAPAHGPWLPCCPHPSSASPSQDNLFKTTAVEVTGIGGWGPKQTSQPQGSPSFQARPGPVIPGTSLSVSDPAAGKQSSRLLATSYPATPPPSLGTLTPDCSQPGSSVHGILQASIIEWVACPPPRNLPDPGIEPESLTSPALAGGFFTTSTT